MSKIGVPLVGVAPRPLSEQGWGWWCYICRKDLGEASGNHPDNRRQAILHVRQHRQAMREQI